MGTTANRSYPYPEGTDLVIEGDDAIQALADAVDVDVDWTNTVAHIMPADSPSTADGTAIAFTGTQALMAGFTYAAGVLTYDGPAQRMFLANVDVSLSISDPSGTSTLASATSLKVNGADIEGTYDEITLTGSSVLSARQLVHKIGTFLLLNPGDTVTVVATSSAPVKTVGLASIKLQPLGGYQ